MKVGLLILIISLLNYSCDSERSYLVTVEDNHKVNLQNLDSVQQYLEGFWVLETDLLKTDYDLLRLDFNEKGKAYWEKIPFSKEIEDSRTWPIESCESIVELIKTADTKVQIQLTELGGRDTIDISRLTKTNLTMGGEKYLKHKGYSFMN